LKFGWMVGSVCFLALFCFAIWQSLLLPFGDRIGPGPGFFPFWLGLLGAVLSVALIVEVSRLPPDDPKDKLTPDMSAIGRILAVLVLLTAAALVFNTLGFRLTALGFTLLLLPALGARSLIAIPVVSLMASFGVFHTFYYWLKVPLPIGMFGI
jgi:putative tricarboxylic transport membrane protein